MRAGRLPAALALGLVAVLLQGCGQGSSAPNPEDMSDRQAVAHLVCTKAVGPALEDSYSRALERLQSACASVADDLSYHANTSDNIDDVVSACLGAGANGFLATLDNVTQGWVEACAEHAASATSSAGNSSMARAAAGARSWWRGRSEELTQSAASIFGAAVDRATVFGDRVLQARNLAAAEAQSVKLSPAERAELHPASQSGDASEHAAGSEEARHRQAHRHQEHREEKFQVVEDLIRRLEAKRRWQKVPVVALTSAAVLTALLGLAAAAVWSRSKKVSYKSLARSLQAEDRDRQMWSRRLGTRDVRA